MSIVAWDGKSIATDRLATNSEMRMEAAKSRRLSSGIVLAWTGDISSGMAMAEWFERKLSANGEGVPAFPGCQGDKDRWARLIVASREGCFFYEQEPIEVPVLGKFMAWGSGRDYAMGAMAMGASAKEAVEVASRFCVSCGFGVDVYDLGVYPMVQLKEFSRSVPLGPG